MKQDIYKARVKAIAKDTIKSGQVITAVTKVTCLSKKSFDNARKKAYEKAKYIVINDLKKQVEILNKIIDDEEKTNFGNLIAKPHYLLNDNTEATQSLISSPINGYSVSQIKSIYNVKPIYNIGSSRKVSITIIIAYHHPNLQSDFDSFCSIQELPSYKLNQINLDSSTNVNVGWGQEECLDIQWAYAMNPNADIRVIEAKSSSFVDLFEAIQYANNPLNGVTDIISMSWGTNEFGKSQNTFDNIYFANNSICYLAASGDANTVNWPATSPKVLACGGTTLNSSSPNYSSRISETTWSLAGCGYSTVYSKPTYQSGVSKLKSYKNRCIPDLSATGNPSSGVQVVYNGNLLVFGGTSVSTPINAGMLSIAIQKRLNTGKPSITTSYIEKTNQVNLLQNILYKNIYSNPASYVSNFYDVVSGKDGKQYTSGVGFDVPTGLGVQKCDNLASIISST